jgi:hypothetical protein
MPILEHKPVLKQYRLLISPLLLYISRRKLVEKTPQTLQPSGSETNARAALDGKLVAVALDDVAALVAFEVATADFVVVLEVVVVEVALSLSKGDMTYFFFSICHLS